jgi:hypothetical protein
MSARVAVIIGTGERDKAEAGLMYAVNAVKCGWLDDVQLFFFGPSEALLLQDEDLQEYLREFGRLGRSATACRFLADREGTSGDLTGLGLEVSYVGEKISELIKAGYTPLVW